MAVPLPHPPDCHLSAAPRLRGPHLYFLSDAFYLQVAQVSEKNAKNLCGSAKLLIGQNENGG